MSTAELVQQIKRLSNPERLQIIEETTALVEADRRAEEARSRDARAERMRAAALRLKPLYEPGGELTEWNALDGEEILDDTTPQPT